MVMRRRLLISEDAKRENFGFASKANMERFTEHGYALETLLDDQSKMQIVETWVHEAMGWVNKDVIKVDDDDSESDSDGMEQKKPKFKPFVPSFR